MITAATMVTLGRLLLTPWIVYAITVQQWRVAFILVLVALVSDLLDGFIARYYNQITVIGQLLDPLTDKFLICSSLYACSSIVPDSGLPIGILQLIIVKELLMIIGGIVIHYWWGARLLLPQQAGKIAMVLQSCLLLGLIMQQLVAVRMVLFTTVFAYITLIAVLLSLFFYATGVLRWFVVGRLPG
ncbi:CDP-alcohol phosphatidyltransferase family protein [Candidatus Dependentiae bacterium]|nr:CDP-alcohol phosphatidyltransferase family protein [Candidatus Dependentiae bacterium]